MSEKRPQSCGKSVVVQKTIPTGQITTNLYTKVMNQPYSFSNPHKDGADPISRANCGHISRIVDAVLDPRRGGM